VRLLPSDPDIQTLVTRIRKGELVLQPNFQRGEVWSTGKKRRLIDSILREWHIPPIHVIVRDKDEREEVLDGQQRLTAIRDFVDGKITVDGTIEPADSELEALNGRRYDELPDGARRRFDRFTIRIFRIVDFTAEEPGELFFRLNQPTGLTSAEQRNAFFGPGRQQVKDLVELCISKGIDEAFLGFSNSRMAYDDVLARVCLSLDLETLSEKVTSSRLTDRYRSSDAFPSRVVERCESAIKLLASARPHLKLESRFNKATLYSWLCFLAFPHPIFTEKNGAERLAQFLAFFELGRSDDFELLGDRPRHVDLMRKTLAIYDDRASSRVADVSSVLARHAALWIALTLFIAVVMRGGDASEPFARILKLIDLAIKGGESGDMLVGTILQQPHWGQLA